MIRVLLRLLHMEPSRDLSCILVYRYSRRWNVAALDVHPSQARKVEQVVRALLRDLGTTGEIDDLEMSTEESDGRYRFVSAPV